MRRRRRLLQTQPESSGTIRPRLKLPIASEGMLPAGRTSAHALLHKVLPDRIAITNSRYAAYAAIRTQVAGNVTLVPNDIEGQFLFKRI